MAVPRLKIKHFYTIYIDYSIIWPGLAQKETPCYGKVLIPGRLKTNTSIVSY